LPDQKGSLLLQLPLNPSAPFSATGNVPLAGASLASAAGLPPETLLDQEVTDIEGDRSLADTIAERSPELVAFTLYMWNVERSIWLAKTLKDRQPGIITVAGGPEVTEDNEWLISSGAFDLMVSGEGEELADRILNPVSAGNIIRQNGNFLDTGRMSFIPGTYSNPWLTGYLDPSGRPSVYVETIRGCSGGCTYCSYRRNHPSPRIMNAKNASELLRSLISAGAGEIVFLDPTFNSRGDLIELLAGMSRMNSNFFAEMRGELISPGIASLIADAGFKSVEIGLQSVNMETLIRVGRPVNPVEILEGALNLKKEGVKPILDIILGLPGDKPEDAIRTALMIKDRNLHQNMQVFYLSILPGTSMRQEFLKQYMPRPPYYRLIEKSLNDFADAREEIADIAGYDLDLAGRPILFENWEGTELIDLSNNPGLIRKMPSFRQGAIRFISEDLWMERKLLLEFVRTRLNADPFCVLDVVLCPEKAFPLNLVDLIRKLDEPVDYSGRTAAILGRQGNLRVSILIDNQKMFSTNWMTAASANCTVVVNVNSPSELRNELWEAGVCVRLPGSNWDMKELSLLATSMHQVFFADRQMENSWSKFMDL